MQRFFWANSGRIPNMAIGFGAMFLIPFVILLLAWRVIAVDQNNGVQELKLQLDYSTEIQLPFSRRILNDKNRDVALSFETINTSSMEMPYLYIPFYEAHLKIFNADDVIYDSDIAAKWRNATHLENVMVPLPNTKNLMIRAEIHQNNDIFLNISEFFVGPFAKLEKYDQKHSYYYYDLRTAFWGAEILVLCLLLALAISSRLGQNSLTPIIILTFITIVGLSSQANSIPVIKDIYPYCIASIPLFCVAMLSFQLDIQNKPYHSTNNYIYLTVFCLFVMCIARFTNSFSIQIWNLYVSTPILLITNFWILIRSLVNYLRSPTTQEMFFITACILVFICVSHDLSFRYGYNQNGVITVNLASAYLFFYVTAFYFIRTFDQNIALSKHKIVLESSLTELQLEMELKYKQNLSLIRQNISAQEMARLNEELHDGIMTNVSMIRALSESEKGKKALSINLLSQSIITEIRVLLMLRESKHTTLLMALSVLKKQILDPAETLGVSVDWSAVELDKLPEINKETTLDIIRIIQEALHNSLIRAGSKTISFKGGIDVNNNIILELKNSDGEPFNKTHTPGFGLTNMAARAAKIGADFSLNGTPDGAILILKLSKSVWQKMITTN